MCSMCLIYNKKKKICKVLICKVLELTGWFKI